MPPRLVELPTIDFVGLPIISARLPTIVSLLAARPAYDRFSYIITPNADHFVRLQRDRARLITLYQSAGCLLLDSRVVAGLGRLLNLETPTVVTGSDLTLELFEQVIGRNEAVTVVGTTVAAVDALKSRFQLTRVAHHCPAFGFERSERLIDECAEFVEAHPARFVFLACGAPRQEILAHRILARQVATGIGLCIGAAIDQIGGYEKRAPRFIRANGLEWAWRIVKEPKRLGLRYLDDLKIIKLLVVEKRKYGVWFKS